MLSALAKSKSINLAAIFLLVIAAPFFFLGGPSELSTPLFRAIWDCGHLAFFAGFVFIAQSKIDITKTSVWFLLSLFVFMLGGAIEIIQAHIGRDGNWQDLLRDLAGMWFGLFWLQKSSAKVWVGRIAAIVILYPSISKVYETAQNQYFAIQQFPVIANFESEYDLHGLKGRFTRTTEVRSEGNYSLNVRLSTDPAFDGYATFSLNEFFNSWQGYTHFSFDIYNPNLEALNLTIRIEDVKHGLGDNAYNDRFNQKLQLVNGWNRIDIPVNDIQHAPATRELQLDHIKSIVIFASKLPAPRDFYIDNIKLQ